MRAHLSCHRLIQRGCAIACLLLGPVFAQTAIAQVARPNTSAACQPWPRWETFKAQFISPDGRVIDVGSVDTRTVSEGQSYGLFFALVANDKPAFEKLLGWTQEHLADGDLTGHLPSWLWGQKKDGGWGVLDSNSASDADLWIAYSLLQAGRQWHERRYTALGALLARRILREETALLPGLGQTVLPAPTGFQNGANKWRLNPSYVPLQVLQGLAAALPDQPQWKQMRIPALRLITETAAHGFSPDWIQFEASASPADGKAAGRTAAFTSDADTASTGSYDAIRIYLWAGMLASADPARAQLLKTFQPMADYIGEHGYPPEKVDTGNTGNGRFGPNAGPSGFSAAVIPLLDALNRPALVDRQLVRIRDLEQQAPIGYFSQVLTLFGTGWREGRYRFSADGSLRPAWGGTCSSGLQ